jgi:hypothetical protein
MRLSQGPTTIPYNGDIEKKRPAPPIKTPSQKRARLEDGRDKENGIRLHVDTWKKGNKVERDEKALMDDLMAGLDASMFDGLASSPVKSQVISQVQRDSSPVGIKGRRTERQASPAKTIKVEKHRSPLRPTGPSNRPTLPIPKVLVTPKPEVKRVPKAFVPIKLELVEDIKPAVETVKVDIKPVLEDEDEYTFDLDLDELAGMDDDLLLKPHVTAKVRQFVERIEDELMSSRSIQSRIQKYLLRQLDIGPPPGRGVRLNLCLMVYGLGMARFRTFWTSVMLDLAQWLARYV